MYVTEYNKGSRLKLKRKEESTKTCYIFTLTVDIQNLMCGFEDILQQIFFPKFHQTPTLLGGGADTFLILLTLCLESVLTLPSTPLPPPRNIEFSYFHEAFGRKFCRRIFSKSHKGFFISTVKVKISRIEFCCYINTMLYL